MLAAGFTVHLFDSDQRQLEGAYHYITTTTKMLGRDQAALGGTLANLKLHQHSIHSISGEGFVALQSSTVVFEAIPEDAELKRKLFAVLESICPPTTCFASNSSKFPVKDLLPGNANPTRYLNAHFLQAGMDPVEVQPHARTTGEIVDKIRTTLTQAGLVPITVDGEEPGFAFNIVWRAIKRETLHLVANKQITPADFDRLWMMALGTPIGPFGLMDMVGLDVVYAIEKAYASASLDPTDNPPDFLRGMIESGNLGQKSGKGFYTYPNPAYRKVGFLEHGENIPPEFLPTQRTLCRTWKLVSCETHLRDRQIVYPFSTSPAGTLTYSWPNQMSVFLGTPPIAEGMQSRQLSYAGTWILDPALKRVIHQIAHASDLTMIGTQQIRAVRIVDGKLELTAGPGVAAGIEFSKAVLVWEPT